MSRWWKGMAVVAAWLGLGGAGWAQPGYDGRIPSPVGAARMPEPAPCGPSQPTPPLVPGPLTPQMAPPGPGPELSLPADHTSAFQCEDFAGEQACYASVGWMALQRSSLPRAPLAFRDLLPLDTGIPRPFGRPALDFRDIHPDFNSGVRATVGYLSDNNALELTGFYVFEATDRHRATNRGRGAVNRGRLDAPFFNPPLGFEGDNGLWLQADRMDIALTSALGNVELNCRTWNIGIHGGDLILGVRYLNYRENFDFFTGDDDLTFPTIFGTPDPTRQATYTTRVRNQILAPQIGFEYTTPLPHNCCGCHLSWIWLGWEAKAAVGVNFIRFHNTLTRGDGFVGFDSVDNTIRLGQIYELGAFLDFHLLERARVRVGYNALWVVDVAKAPEQLDFNLANPVGRENTTGTTFFHGPLVELQLLF
jgi:hypothetical protein